MKRLHGRETVLIAVIMAVFALLGSTYGFCEETIPFYGLLAATMYAAGFDTMVAAATVLLGAGVGCLGSTVNPFACGVAIDSLASVGLEVNQGVVIALGVILTVVSYLISLFFILRYAKPRAPRQARPSCPCRSSRRPRRPTARTPRPPTVPLCSSSPASARWRWPCSASPSRS